jgi:glucan phosphoethanolaminetransferase (alkaline phosphatase superfamily)
MLRKPGLILGLATGVSLGIAYLCKASALLGFYLFIAVFIVMVCISTIRLASEKPVERRKFRLPLQSIASLLLTLLAFFAVTYPYIRIAKQRFGHYFYNVNSTFYLWYDSFEAAKQANLEYGFSQKWPDQLPQDEIPSLKKYLREHSIQEISDRIRFGIETQTHNLSRQYSITNFMLSYLTIFLLAILVDIRHAFSLAKRSPYMICFSMIYILVHIASFIWYSSISIGPRFTLGIFLPIMFSCFAGIKCLAENQETGLVEQGVQPGLLKFSLAANVLMTVILIGNIWLVLSGGIISGHFGS